MRRERGEGLRSSRYSGGAASLLLSLFHSFLLLSRTYSSEVHMFFFGVGVGHAMGILVFEVRWMAWTDARTDGGLMVTSVQWTDQHP
jgi:hypothetical protein